MWVLPLNRCEEVKKICRCIIEVALCEQLLPLCCAHTRYQLFGCYMKSTLHNTASAVLLGIGIVIV